MHLSKIRDTASKFATIISRILDVDVMIIDSSFTRVANTYRYVDEPPAVRPNSITGHAITSGKVVVVSDKKDYEGCRGCADKESCCISQIIAVPILYEGAAAGAIDLLVPFGKHSAVFDNLELSIDFLEGMADLLGSKLRNFDDYDRLSVIRKEREILLDFMEDAIVYTNEIGEIVHWNSQFGELFQLGKSSEGAALAELIDHPLIKGAIEGQRQVSNQQFAYSDRNVAFTGFLSNRIIQRNGVRYGMVFLFKSVDNAYGVLNQLSGGKSCLGFDSFRSDDPALSATVARAKMLAVTEDPILITGPSGSGKSMLARAIHSYSDHADRPFVVVDCSAFSSECLEAEIFGSPVAEGSGPPPASKLRIAQNGTIYFMRVDELPLYLQKRLVAVMKERTLSGRSEVAARMIFSSSRDLSPLRPEAGWDEELAVRVSQNVIRIPPLDERPADVRMFALHFLAKYCRIYGKGCALGEEALALLCSRRWPGETAQIERVMERIAEAAGEGSIDPRWLGSMLASIPESGAAAVESLEESERRLIERALGRYPSNDDAARALGIGRATLYRKLKQYGISHRE